MKYLVLLLFTTAFVTLSRAQTIEGDALIDLLGKRIDAPATQQFFKMYGINKKMPKVYTSSQTGIRVAAGHDTVITEINLYKDNQFFGSYKNKLPKGLNFKMSLNEVVKKLGAPNYISPEGQFYRDCVYRTAIYEFDYSSTNGDFDQANYRLRKP